MKSYDKALVIVGVVTFLSAASAVMIRFVGKPAILPDAPQQFSIQALQKLRRYTERSSVNTYYSLQFASYSLTGVMVLILVVMLANRKYFDDL